MEEKRLSAELRTSDFGTRGSRRLLRSGRIPGVIYGKNKPVHVTVSEKEFMPRMACCTAMKAGISLPNIIASSPERPIAKLTGTPSTRKIRSVTRDISIIYLLPSRYSFASWGMALA